MLMRRIVPAITDAKAHQNKSRTAKDPLVTA